MPAVSSKYVKSLTNVTHIEFESKAEDIKAGLIDTFLNLERIDNDIYMARHIIKGRKSRNAAFGGQVVGQALAAAAATVDEKFIPHSLHSYFIKQGNVDKPILYMIDRVRDGRSFCTRIVKAVQDGEAIFSCQVSFHQKEQDAIVHQHVMPNVPDPETLLDAKAAALKLVNSEEGDKFAKAVVEYARKEISPAVARIFDVRPVNPTQFMVGEDSEPHSLIWIRAKENIGDDHRLHQCVAAYLTDFSMVNTAIRPHLRKGFVPSMSFSLDHCLWLHEPDFRVDDWMLYETISSKANSSRAFIEGRLWTKSGKLVVSSAQEGLIRTHLQSKL